MSIEVKTISVTPVEGQLPGTSGLRKPVSVVTGNPNFLHNFFQCIFDVLPKEQYVGRSLVIAGDGRYYNRTAIQEALKVAAANGVSRVWVGQHGWMSTPAVSACVRKRRAFGAIILTASHNPGGPEGDFGIKYNIETGAPAPAKITDAIYDTSKTISRVHKAELPDVDLDTTQRNCFELASGNLFVVDVIEPTEDWVELMMLIFNIEMIKKLVQRSKGFSFCYDGLNGIAGPFAKKILVEICGADISNLQGCEPLEDFGGCHPDPNLTYAKKLVDRMKVFGTPDSQTPLFGAAGDGDNDRNMILGKGFFVTPSDSLAIIAHYATKCIPYYQKEGLRGIARSMPTSRAADFVAAKLNLKCHEVPTGWKFFGNLMDAKLVNLCGEESFGTGSDHIREKDGLWAILCWLSILAYRNPDPQAEIFVGVEQIVKEFWKEYGRVFYMRYDYEGVTIESVNSVMQHALESKLGEVSEFSYKDPVDGSLAEHQGVIVKFNLDKQPSRIILRSSGTGSKGATLRMYMETLASWDAETNTVMDPLIKTALDLTDVRKFTGRDEPTVKT